MARRRWSCRSCGAALGIAQRPRGLCDDPECRRRDVPFQQERRREAAIATALSRAERAWPDMGLRPVTLLPQFHRPLVPLPADRRATFERHLDRILEQAADEWAPLLPPRAETGAPSNGLSARDAGLPVLGSACAFCRGQCCEGGGDTAWIEVATIQRNQPEATEPDLDSLRAAYLDRLPTVVFEGSCVFHAEHGCALPRDLRSNICNQFACEGLAALADAWKRTGGRCLVAAGPGSAIRVGRVDGALIDDAPTLEDGSDR